MIKTRFISAICTPLDEDDSLDVVGLEAHIDDQFASGTAGLLVGGSMGLMQLLRDDTYRSLIKEGARHVAGRGELLVGVGDLSFARTLERIRYVEEFHVDGVVVLAPFFIRFSQSDLKDYYQMLADEAKKPLYIYDLPGRTGVDLSLDLLTELARHPNICGIKCSISWERTRELMERVGNGFRVIPVQAKMIPQVVREGFFENLDGIYSVVPGHTVRIAEAAEDGDWEEANKRQETLSAFLDLVVEYDVFPAVNAILEARGVATRVAPKPYRILSKDESAALLAKKAVRDILGDAPP